MTKRYGLYNETEFTLFFMLELRVTNDCNRFLQSGGKTVEVRLGGTDGETAEIWLGKRLHAVRIGETIRINGTNYRLNDAAGYKNIRNLLEGEGLGNVWPDAASVEETIREFGRFYRPEQINRLGLVALRVQLLTTVLI